jgi:hypothetical protein
MLLGLAGAFHTEYVRWTFRNAENGYEVIRMTDDPTPNDVEVKAHCKTYNEAADCESSLSDMAAAMAFMMAMNKIGDNSDLPD